MCKDRALKHAHAAYLPHLQEGDTLVLVLEYVRGGPLDRARRKLGGRMTEQQAVQLVVSPLLRTLHYLHSQGIIHRDIKPVSGLQLDSVAAQGSVLPDVFLGSHDLSCAGFAVAIYCPLCSTSTPNVPPLAPCSGQPAVHAGLAPQGVRLRRVHLPLRGACCHAHRQPRLHGSGRTHGQACSA